MADLGFSCSCGQVAGYIDVPSPSSGNHCYCHCPDCRAAALFFGGPDPAGAGVHIWQTRTDRIHFTQGHDQIARFQLTPRGVFRWYAACCNTQLSTSMQNPRLPVGGFLADRLDNVSDLGPVIGNFFIAKPGGGYRHEGLFRLGPRYLRMVISANISGKWRQSPFLDSSGNALGPCHLITKEERAELMRR